MFLLISVIGAIIGLSCQCDERNLNRCNAIIADYRQAGGHAATQEYCSTVAEAKDCFEREASKCDNRRVKSDLYDQLRNAEKLDHYCKTGRCSKGNIDLCAAIARNPKVRDEEHNCKAVAGAMHCLRLAERECSTDDERAAVLQRVGVLRSAEAECSKRGYEVYDPNGASKTISNLFHSLMVVAITVLFFQ